MKTGHKPGSPQCALGKLFHSRDTEKAKRDGWHEQGILVVSVNDARLDSFDKQWVQNIGELIYGQA